MYKERAELEAEIKSLNYTSETDAENKLLPSIITLTERLNTYGDIDINFESMEELDAAIERCKKQIAKLISKLNEANMKKYENKAFNMVIDSLIGGHTIEEALNVEVAFSYKDGNENIIYEFDLSKITPFSNATLLAVLISFVDPKD